MTAKAKISQPLASGTASALAGTARVAGDKSISHRALMIGAVAVGETTIDGLSAGDDVRRTGAALAALGAGIEGMDGATDGGSLAGTVRVHGVGVGGLHAPSKLLDMGNSGTGARLLMGLLATHAFTAQLTGDESLCARPMGRIARPLELMGAEFMLREGDRLPGAVIGTSEPLPIDYSSPVPSAQLKSAILLAGLNTPGETTVIEAEDTRDHTELMLGAFGATVRSHRTEDGRTAITLSGQPELTGQRVAVPGDPSAAAFPGVAALVIAGSCVTIPNICMNPRRAGLFETLQEMGADLTVANRRVEAGEIVADLTFRASRLEAVEVPAARAPSMIDEYPILAVAAAFARGRTRMLGLAELRVKESDRLAAIAEGLAAAGVRVAVEGDSLVVEGDGNPPPGGAEAVRTRLDHRIAMSMLVLGMAARRPVTIDDGATIATSFPSFARLMNQLGATIADASHG